ncbi:MAG: hypothetical protein LN410_03650 [Candidatus Thermoplasmatota archaeon]|nr:hypothetical protein [Candidatus Thermoplasmatota archaeon]
MCLRAFGFGGVIGSPDQPVWAGETTFQFKPLVGDVPSGAADHIEYDLTDQCSTLAAGTATIAAVPAAAPIDMVLMGEIIAVVVTVIIIVVVILVRRRGGQGPE